MGKLLDFVRGCIEELKCAGRVNTSSDAEVLLEVFAEQMDTEIAKKPDAYVTGYALTQPENLEEGVYSINQSDGSQGIYLKWTDDVLTDEQILGGRVMVRYTLGEVKPNIISETHHEDMQAFVVPISKDGEVWNDMVFPERGTYFVSFASAMALEFTSSDYGAVPLGEKYIPSTIQRVGEDVLLTSPNGTLYKLSVADDGTLSAAAVE